MSDNIGVSKSCAWIWANPKKKKGEWKAKLKSWAGHSVTLANFVKNCPNIFIYSIHKIWINLLGSCQNSTIKDCEKNKSLYKYQVTFPPYQAKKNKGFIVLGRNFDKADHSVVCYPSELYTANLERES